MADLGALFVDLQIDTEPLERIERRLAKLGDDPIRLTLDDETVRRQANDIARDVDRIFERLDADFGVDVDRSSLEAAAAEIDTVVSSIDAGINTDVNDASLAATVEKIDTAVDAVTANVDVDVDERALAASQARLAGLGGTSAGLSGVATGAAIGAAGTAVASAAALGSALLASGGAFAYAGAKAADFEEQLSAVAAVSGATDEQMALLRDQALQLGRDTVFSAAETAGAQGELLKAGVSLDQVLGGALTGTLSLASAGGIDLGAAATIAANALNTFGLAGDQTTRVADTLSAAANKSATDVGELAFALQQSGLVADQLNIPLEDTVGVLAAFGQAGLKGSDAGTSFKTMLQRLVPQSEEQAKAMAALGLDFFDAQGNFVGIEEAAGRLQTALSGLTEEQRASALTTIFGSDAVRAASILYEQGAGGIRGWIGSVNDAGFAGEVAAKRLDNLKGDLEGFKGSIETVFIGAGSAVQPQLRRIVQSATELVNGLEPTIAKLITPFADLAASAVETLLPALEPVLDALAYGAEQAGGLLQQAFGGLAESGVLDKLATVFSQLVDIGVRFAGPVIDAIISAAGPLLDALSSLAPVVENVAGMLGEGLADIVNQMVSDGIFEKLATAIGEILAALTPVIPVIVEIAGVLIDLLGPALEWIAYGWGDLLPRAIGFLVEAFGNGFANLTEVAAGFIGIFATMAEGLQNFVDLAPDALVPDELQSGIDTVVSKLRGAQNAIRGYGSVARNVGSTIRDQAQDYASLDGPLERQNAQLGNLADGGLPDYRNAAEGAFGGAADAAEQSAQRISDAVESLPTIGEQFTQGTDTSIRDAISQAEQAASDASATAFGIAVASVLGLDELVAQALELPPDQQGRFVKQLFELPEAERNALNQQAKEVAAALQQAAEDTAKVAGAAVGEAFVDGFGEEVGKNLPPIVNGPLQPGQTRAKVNLPPIVNGPLQPGQTRAPAVQLDTVTLGTDGATLAGTRALEAMTTAANNATQAASRLAASFTATQTTAFVLAATQRSLAFGTNAVGNAMVGLVDDIATARQQLRSEQAQAATRTAPLIGEINVTDSALDEVFDIVVREMRRVQHLTGRD